MTTKTTGPIDLGSLRRLEEAATEAPWVAINTLDEDSEWADDFDDPMVVTEDSTPGAYSAIAKGICQGATDGVADAEFIAAARNAMPGLLSLIAEQAAEIDRLGNLLGEQVDASLADGWNLVADQMDFDAARVTVEWAAEIRYLNGGVKHTAATDESFATIAADSVNLHVESLNEPTRQENGVEGARVVFREVREFPDGSRLIGPWKPVES